MALKSELTLANKSTSKVYIDAPGVQSSFSAIKKDLANINADLAAIQRAYTALKNDKNTKGAWSEVATNCVASCKKNTSDMNNISSNLSDQLIYAMADYVLAIQKLNGVNTTTGF